MKVSINSVSCFSTHLKYSSLGEVRVMLATNVPFASNMLELPFTDETFIVRFPFPIGTGIEKHITN